MADTTRDPVGGWRHLGWSWTMHHDRLILGAYWMAGFLIAFALGNGPSLITGDWKSGATWVSLWLSVVATVVSIAAFAFAEVARRGRDRMIDRNGNAYVVVEQARFWTSNTAEARFRKGIRRQFARVIQVPGPVEANPGWDWSLDGDAWQWDARVDELVRAFRVLAIDAGRDGSAAGNGVFLWAYWAVATAFGMRVTAADRAPVLDVWQRPSNARAGEVDPAIWSVRPQRFAVSAPTAESAGLEFTEHRWPADLRLSQIATGDEKLAGRLRRGRVTVLLLRFSAAAWGPLPDLTDPAHEGPLVLDLRFATDALRESSAPVEVHELRCVPPGAPAGGQFSWQQFPALADEASGWIRRKAKELDSSTLLLGTLLPQEVGLGLGVLAGQESQRASWPDHLWPVVRDARYGELVVPNLDLGKVGSSLLSRNES